jgi:hypothetical protein
MVRDGMQYGAGAEGQACRLLLQVLPQAGQLTVLTVPDRDDEPRPAEHHHLAGLNHLAGGGQILVRDVPDGLEYGEQRVVVPLELGALVRLGRVLQGQCVQTELLADDGQLAIVRLEQADPDEPLAALGPGQRLGVGVDPAVAVTVAIEAPVDQCAVQLAAGDQIAPGRAVTGRTPGEDSSHPACRAHVPPSPGHHRRGYQDAVTSRRQ